MVEWGPAIVVSLQQVGTLAVVLHDLQDEWGDVMTYRTAGGLAREP